MKTDVRQALFAMLGASLAFALMAACVKGLSGTLPTAQVVALRCAFSVPLLVVVMRWRGTPLLPRNPRLVLLRSIFGIISMGAFFFGIARLAVGDSVVIMKTQPLWIALLAPVLLKEQLRRSTLPWIALAFVGVAAIAQPTLDSGGLGVAAVLISALFSALAHMVLKRASRTDDPWTITLGFSVFGTLCALPFLAGGAVALTPTTLALAVAMSVTANAGQVLMSYAYRGAPATLVAPMGFSYVVFAALLGFLLFGDTPSLGFFVGAPIIAYATVRLSQGERTPRTAPAPVLLEAEASRV